MLTSKPVFAPGPKVLHIPSHKYVFFGTFGFTAFRISSNFGMTTSGSSWFVKILFKMSSIFCPCVWLIPQLI